jgi:O-antigen/teichoic acid export membrane protein
MREPGEPTSSTLLGTSAHIFIIRFLPALASVAAVVWLSRYTTPAYYGRYQRFWVQWQVLHVVACLGLPTLVLTYPPAAIGGVVRKVSRQAGPWLLGWVLLVATGFAAMQAWAGSPFAPWQAGAFLLLNVPVAVLEAYVLGQRQLPPIAVVSACYAGLFGLAHALLVGHWLSSEQLMHWLLVGSALRVGALGYLARRAAYVPTPAVSVAWRAVWSLWGHTALNEVVQVLFRWVDKFVLNFLLPAALFALYFNGTIDVPFVPLLLGAVGSTLLLHFGELHLSDAERISALKEAAALLGRLVFPLFCFLLCFRYELFGVGFTHRYDAGVPLFVVASLVVPLRAYNFTALLQHKAQGRTITTGAVLDLLLALVLMYPLYQLLGLVGVALAFVISTYCQAGYYLWHTAQLLHVPWHHLLPWKIWAAQLLGAGLLIVVLHALLAWLFSESVVLWAGAGLLGLGLASQLWQARQA